MLSPMTRAEQCDAGRTVPASLQPGAPADPEPNEQHEAEQWNAVHERVLLQESRCQQVVPKLKIIFKTILGVPHPGALLVMQRLVDYGSCGGRPPLGGQRGEPMYQE